MPLVSKSGVHVAAWGWARLLRTTLSSMRLLVFNNVAELGGPDGAAEAGKELVGAAGAVVDDELLGEAEVLGVDSESVSHSLSDGLGAVFPHHAAFRLFREIFLLRITLLDVSYVR